MAENSQSGVSEQVTNVPKRRRGTHLTMRILEAALVEIANAGVKNFSVEAVAARAGTNKSTIYRRWGGAAALIVNALEQKSDLDRMPGTGNLRTDLLEYVERYQAVCRSPAVVSMMQIQLAGDPTSEAAKMVRRRMALGDAQLLRLFRKGAARGDIPVTADSVLLRNLFLGALQHLLIFRAVPFSPPKLKSVVDAVLKVAS